MAFVHCGAISQRSSSRIQGRRVCKRRPRSAQTGTLTRCAAANPSDSLSSEQLDEWKQVSDLVRSINSTLDAPAADKIVGRAFGWGTQKFWRGDVKNEAPSLQQAEDSITFLRERVGLDDAGVKDVVKKFPEVLRLRKEKMSANVDKVQSDYPNIKGKLLTNAVRATPAVLGYDYDCEGDCASECARCWVQF